MIEWLKNFVANFSVDDLLTILNTLFSTGVGMWALRVYSAYKKLKDKDVETIVKTTIGDDNADLYNKITSYLDTKLAEQDSKIEKVNSNLILTTISKVSDSDKIIAMINNSNLTQEHKEEVKQVVNESVKTEETKKQEKIDKLEAM